MVYKVINTEEYKLPQVAFTVSKSKFKSAVDRNRIKRLMREAYRTNKHEFLDTLQQENKSLALMFVYNNYTLPNLSQINIAAVKVLQGVKF